VIENERRSFQRLRLITPVEALFDNRAGLILDLGLTGALVEHHGDLAQSMVIPVSFHWNGRDLEFSSRVMRTLVKRPGNDSGASPLSQSGVRFESAARDSRQILREMLATLVGKVIAAQKANARGEFAGEVIEEQAVLADLGRARRSRSKGYTIYRLRGLTWWHFPTDSPVQPVDGFTVADYEDQDDVAVLCRAYERCKDEGRRLVRLLAELSVETVMAGPPDPR
jgi:hypothetical protein